MKEKTEIKEHFTDATTKETRDALKGNMDVILKNIIRFMEEKKISQSELASRIDSEPSHVNRMLRTRTKNGITINVLGRIAKALNIHLKDLVQ